MYDIDDKYAYIRSMYLYGIFLDSKAWWPLFAATFRSERMDMQLTSMSAARWEVLEKLSLHWFGSGTCFGCEDLLLLCTAALPATWVHADLSLSGIIQLAKSSSCAGKHV